MNFRFDFSHPSGGHLNGTLEVSLEEIMVLSSGSITTLNILRDFAKNDLANIIREVGTAVADAKTVMAQTPDTITSWRTHHVDHCKHCDRWSDSATASTTDTVTAPADLLKNMRFDTPTDAAE